MIKVYNGYIPPCGIFCGGCPRYKSGAKNSCNGAGEHCVVRRCKGIFVCCVEKKGLRFCHECSTFPCARFKKFALSWEQYGQDLVENQGKIKDCGEKEFLDFFNGKSKEV